jgi:hypothetical protein
MTYSDKIQDFYPNKFIIGPYVHDRKTHKTIVPEKIEPSETDDTSSMNVPYNYNEVYDLHYFLISLLDLYISEELFNWIISIYPPELIPKDNESNSSDLSSNLSSKVSSNLSSKVSSNLSSNLSSKVSDNISDDSNDSSSSESSSESSSKSSSGSSSGSRSDSTSEYDEFLSDGRMKCGVEEQFDNLPIPIDIINNSFFDFLRIKPIDFDEKTAIYFDAGF